MKTPLILAVKDATLKVRGKVIFTGLDLVINRGEHWAIIGESRSGKSELLQLRQVLLPYIRMTIGSKITIIESIKCAGESFSSDADLISQSQAFPFNI